VYINTYDDVSLTGKMVHGRIDALADDDIFVVTAMPLFEFLQHGAINPHITPAILDTAASSAVT